jgi:hypothetical protein
MISDILSDAVHEIRDHYLKDPTFADCYVGEMRKRIKAGVAAMDALRRELDCPPIDVHDGSTSEEWLVVFADGRIVHHIESNGPRILRHGCEPHEEVITLADVAELDARHPNKHLVEQVQAALAKIKASTVNEETSLAHAQPADEERTHN